MTVNKVATILLTHLSPEERNIPDSVDYPGRNAVVIAAMNAALQEMFIGARPWVACDDVGALLPAPKTVSVLRNAGEYDATIDGWESWMAGCTIVLEGEGQDNRIKNDSNPASLMIPASTTGTFSAVFYADSVSIAPDVIDVRSPVLADGRILTYTQTRDPRAYAVSRRQIDYGSSMNVSYPNRASDCAAQVQFYRVSTWSPGNGIAVQKRIEFYPPPADATAISYKATLAPLVITDLSSNASLPIPLGFVASIYLPICEEALMDSPFFRPSMPDAVIAKAAKARKSLADINPASHRSPRFSPIG